MDFDVQFCHPTDQSHKHVQCVEPCARVPEECTRRHLCRKRCRDACGACEVDVGPMTLPCNHVVDSIRCHDARNDEALKEATKRCKKQIHFRFKPCGHVAETTCGNSRSQNPKCPLLCLLRMDCGHECQNRCAAKESTQSYV